MTHFNQAIAGLTIGTLGALTLAPAANAAVITFDGVANSDVITGQTYGSTAEVAVTYEGGFLGWANGDSYFPSGFGSSGPVIYATTATGVGTIVFTAISGYEVRVDSLVLGIRGANSDQSLLEFSLDEGANWTEVSTSIAPDTAGQVDFTGVQASVVHIRRSDQRSGATGESDAGIDNINYTAVLVPEPGSLALLGLGGLMMMCRRRA